MPVEFNAVPEPDDFDQQLRDLTSGQAEPAKFTELSAAERARRVPSPPQTRSSRLNWRNARKAKQLRKPLGPQGLPGPQGPQGPQGRKQPGRGGPGPARRRNPQPRPASTGRQRLIAAVRAVGILVAFVALLIGLHLLGFGPQ